MSCAAAREGPNCMPRMHACSEPPRSSAVTEQAQHSPAARALNLQLFALCAGAHLKLGKGGYGPAKGGAGLLAQPAIKVLIIPARVRGYWTEATQVPG